MTPIEEPREIELKAWPEFFEEIISGRKTFELRKDDRAYEVGNILKLREWRWLGGYSGREIRVKVTYLLRHKPEFGLQDGYAILGIQPLVFEADAVREALDRAAQACATVDEWLGSATTRQAADEALWRLRRALQAAGVRVPVQAAYDYRGAILHALERAGLGVGEDNEIRQRLESDKPWQHASGPQVTRDCLAALSRSQPAQDVTCEHGWAVDMHCCECRRSGFFQPDNCDCIEPAFDFRAHLQRQREFSERTFGPGARTAGVVDHIRKELLEIEAAPSDASEWADVVILGLDGFWRSGHDPDQIIAAIVAKQTKNEARQWPDWRTQPTDKAIEHDRVADRAALSRSQPAEDNDECGRCGHTALWHSAFGRGECQQKTGCACHEFLKAADRAALSRSPVEPRTNVRRRD